MPIIQTIVSYFTTFAGGIGNALQWLMALASNSWFIIAAVVGFLVLRWALRTAGGLLKMGPKVAAKVAFWGALIVAVLLILVPIGIRLVPQYGNSLFGALRDSMDSITPVPPPGIGVPQSTQAAPGPIIPTITPAPTTTGQSLAAPSTGLTGNYTVSMTDGATARTPTGGICTDTDPLANPNSIPYGTSVTITQTWPSHNIAGNRGLTTTGVCVHLSALTKAP